MQGDPNRPAMTCAHCNIVFNGPQQKVSANLRPYAGDIASEYWAVIHWECPSCRQIIVDLATTNLTVPNRFDRQIRIYPKGTTRGPVPPEVPEEIAEDYREACLVLADSPKAAAALSRRCLQNVLRSAGGVTASDLSKEIQQVIDGATLPSHLARSIDGIRNIGNFGAHPIKSTSTGEIQPVEPGGG